LKEMDLRRRRVSQPINMIVKEAKKKTL
jgi:hypothetical protein